MFLPETIMCEPAASTSVRASFALARVSAVADAISSAIAGFALLAGARAFMFIALLGWREPVLGGAGLLLLALIGWLRWWCGQESRAAARLSGSPSCSRRGPAATARAAGAHGNCVVPACTDARVGQACNVACYNRSIIAVRRDGTASSAGPRLEVRCMCEPSSAGFASREPGPNRARSIIPTAP